jgi:hypothetical protein
MSKIAITLNLVVMLASMHVYGQNIFSSPYSVYGVGFLHARASTLTEGMAGTGIGVRDPFNLNPANPASYGSISSPISHIFETGFYVESVGYRTTNSYDSKTGGGMSHANYWFKFSPWWSATAGLTPYSSVSYNITAQKQFGSEITNADYNYDGSGNISQLYMGNAFRITEHLSAGFHVAYLFGTISKNESIRSNNTKLISLNSNITTNKFDLDFGVQYQFKLSERRSIVVGAVADNGLRLSGKQENTLLYSLDTLNNYTDPNRLNYRLPASGGVGLSFNTPRSILAYDMKFTNWTNAKFGDQNVDFRDTWRYSVGYSYLGNPRATKLLDATIIRTGFYIEDYYLKLKGNTFPMWGFSLGVSVPAFDNRSSINLTYSLDRFGTTNDQLIKQQSQKVIVGIVIRDLWGIKRKFD